MWKTFKEILGFDEYRQKANEHNLFCLRSKHENWIKNQELNRELIKSRHALLDSIATKLLEAGDITPIFALLGNSNLTLQLAAMESNQLKLALYKDMEASQIAASRSSGQDMAQWQHNMSIQPAIDAEKIKYLENNNKELKAANAARESDFVGIVDSVAKSVGGAFSGQKSPSHHIICPECSKNAGASVERVFRDRKCLTCGYEEKI